MLGIPNSLLQTRAVSTNTINGMIEKLTNIAKRNNKSVRLSCAQLADMNMAVIANTILATSVNKRSIASSNTCFIN